jgi:hypothetical protein
VSESVFIPPFLLPGDGSVQYAPWQPIRVFAPEGDTWEGRRELPLPHEDAARVQRESAIFQAYSELRGYFSPLEAARYALESVGTPMTPEQEAALMSHPAPP